MAMISIKEESWFQVAAEAKGICSKHWAEMEDHDSGRVFDLDGPAMARMWSMGMLRIIVAREAGKPVGYCVWTIVPDVECKGALCSQLVGWFMDGKHWGVAREMWNVSMALLEVCDVSTIFPYSRPGGRSGIDRFFLRMGARPIKTVYQLDLKKKGS